ncbi:MAG: radical SAM protein [Candidatus Thorarchaeota archaeon]
MKVNRVSAKSIITKSRIPGIDFVINPYIGCQHGCIYCYAEFMKRFTNHSGDQWGEFLDVKQYDMSRIKPEKYDGKTLLFSSVTDPYTPLEVKYENTKRVLEKLIGTTASIQILTKSKLVTRDIDLFEQFGKIRIGISISTLDERVSRVIEPRASKPMERLEALQTISQAGIPTYVFVSPIFPMITDWQAIIKAAVQTTDDFRFENLNFRSHNISRIMSLVENRFPELKDYYKKIRNRPLMWNEMEEDIESYCALTKVQCKIEFHHGGFSNQ